jgi:hypothetical protein
VTAVPLVVPVALQAMVVAAGTQAFRQWRFDYQALASFDSPEPMPGAGQSTTTARPPGVYLHWDLPDALRHGASDAQDGPVTYPPVPNRWVVVRLSGASRTATAWVVESDCPNSASPALYLVDDAILDAWTASGQQLRGQAAQTVRRSATGGNLVATLGEAFPLAGWSEAAADATFLTAVAPGNVLFGSYEPHCANVFTFYDDMTGVATGDPVSYLVAGWYSNAAEDPLATSTAAALGWSGGDGATATVCQGLALGLVWEPAQIPPSPVTGMAGNVHLGIGNTTIDAFTALVGGQLGGASDGTLLQAFQYGLLPVLADVNGAELLRIAVHQAAFGAKQGPVSWEIVPVDGDGSADATLTAGEAAWLLALNTAQANLDAAQQELDGYRAALYALWWKWQRGQAESVVVPPPGFDADTYATAVQTTLPGLVAHAAGEVATYAAQVPQPVVQPGDTRQDSYLRGVAAFAAAKGLDPAKTLKPVAGPRLWRAADPVVVLSGIEPAPLPDPDATLPCRLTAGLVTALDGIDAAALATVLPSLPNTAAVPPVVPALLLETFLLDPAGAGVIAKATGKDESTLLAAMQAHDPASYTGTLPANDLSPWTQQPWQPLLMEWQAGYVPIPYATGGTPNWAFDGDDYVYDGPFGPFDSDPDAPVSMLGGIAPLTAEAQFTFAGQLAQFVATYVTGNPDPAPELAALAQLDDAIAAVDSWRFMSQSLTGLGDLVALRDTRAQTAPDATVAAAVAGCTGSVPYLPAPPVPFGSVRQGQFVVESLIVYDTFGQVLTVVGGTGTTDPQNVVPTCDPALVPDKPVIQRNPGRLVEVRPRLGQHARLDFSLVDATTDTPLVPGSSGNPVGGWLLPNHLDQGLLLYAPDGTALGEVGLLTDETGTRTARWQPPPHAATTFAGVTAAAPLLASVVGDPAFTGATAFQTFLDAVDTTLWSIDPLGNRADQNLSVLVGRPLALVRAQLALVLDGPPITDPGWASVWPPPPADLLTYDFAVRLGDLASRQDGLVGFWADGQFGTFNSVAAPDAAQSYVRQIGPIGATSGTNYPALRCAAAPVRVTLLLDPRASASATTGILPTGTLTLPAAYVEDPLEQLEITFRIGSLLTHAEQSPASGSTPPANPLAMWLPYPAERNGTWSWWEQSAPDPQPAWTPYDLLRATPDARLKDYPSSLRDGFLQFVADLAPDTDQGGTA